MYIYILFFLSFFCFFCFSFCFSFCLSFCFFFTQNCVFFCFLFFQLFSSCFYFSFFPHSLLFFPFFFLLLFFFFFFLLSSFFFFLFFFFFSFFFLFLFFFFSFVLLFLCSFVLFSFVLLTWFVHGMGGRAGTDVRFFKADQHPSLAGYEEIHILIFTLNATPAERLQDPKPLNPCKHPNPLKPKNPKLRLWGACSCSMSPACHQDERGGHSNEKTGKSRHLGSRCIVLSSQARRFFMRRRRWSASRNDWRMVGGHQGPTPADRPVEFAAERQGQGQSSRGATWSLAQARQSSSSSWSGRGNRVSVRQSGEVAEPSTCSTKGSVAASLQLEMWKARAQARLAPVEDRESTTVFVERLL